MSLISVSVSLLIFMFSFTEYLLPLLKCSKGMLTMKDTEIWPSSFHRLALLWFCPWNPKCFFQSNKHNKCTKLKLQIHNFIANIDCKATRRMSHRRDPEREVESEKSGLPNRPSWPATVEDSKPRSHRGSIAVRRQTKGHWKVFVIKSETDIFQRCWGFIWNQIFSETAAWFLICYDSHTTLLCHRSFRLFLIHYSESTRTQATCVLSSLATHSCLL